MIYKLTIKSMRVENVEFYIYRQSEIQMYIVITGLYFMSYKSMSSELQEFEKTAQQN